MPIQLSTQSRLQVAKVRLQVAKVGFVSRDLPFREALSADCRRPLMADCCLKRPANGPGVVLNFLSSRLVCESIMKSDFVTPSSAACCDSLASVTGSSHTETAMMIPCVSL